MADAEPTGQARLASPRLVERDSRTLRAHPACADLLGPASPLLTTGRRDMPVSITAAGIVIDGFARWQQAVRNAESCVACLEFDISEEGALERLLECQSQSGHLNAYCRICLALSLEAHYRGLAVQRQSAVQGPSASSNLTTARPTDVRREISRVAGVSAGNVTKVKQLQKTAIPEIVAALQKGELTIHRAWTWHRLPRRQQHANLQAHLAGTELNAVIRGLVAKHRPPDIELRTVANPAELLTRLAEIAGVTFTVAVVNTSEVVIAVPQEIGDEVLRQS